MGDKASAKLGGKGVEITRFKGLGEISPDEFVHFIGADIRLDPVMLDKAMSIEELLSFYMGKNTPDRQRFIIDNLKFELDRIEEWLKWNMEYGILNMDVLAWALYK